ncbi:rhamnulokinase family protein [Jonesiaceae bacterium BS-20]|uniref:Rhamnulokinase family protein n=1 Tax=Jonesiaceae bacterium BS-20 TaxID=3120821 RepID=A0AAU7DUD1_9MICO
MNQPQSSFVAIDLGASSGRVMIGRLIEEGTQRIELEEVYRFPNGAVRMQGRLQWEIETLYDGVLTGLRLAAARIAQRGDTLAGIGVDTWAVDYGLLDGSDTLLANPTAYRDERTKRISDRVYEHISPQIHYGLNGLQTLPFNTEFQLIADLESSEFAAAESLLLIPDLINFWLTGVKAAEITNASTTGLIDVTTRTWSTELMEALSECFPGYGKVPAMLAPVVEAGTVIGALTPELVRSWGQGEDETNSAIPVVAVGSHDTASAIVGIPASTKDFAYISCGTWSLVGVELGRPVLTEASREANFTNELGVDGTVRYLRNVMGLWVLQESMRTWVDAGVTESLVDLIHEAGQLTPFTTVVDIDSELFLAPGDMPARIANYAEETGQPVPRTQAEVVRCIIDSLALAYRRALLQAIDLSGLTIEVIHMVGGGIQNELLCQLTADVTGLAVIAGPIEGAVLGNVLVQARAVGHAAVAGMNLEQLRELGSRGVPVKRYLPTSGKRPIDFAELEGRLSR